MSEKTETAQSGFKKGFVNQMALRTATDDVASTDIIVGGLATLVDLAIGALAVVGVEIIAKKKLTPGLHLLTKNLGETQNENENVNVEGNKTQPIKGND